MCDHEDEKFGRHSCPFAGEIGGNDDEDYCDCCSECTDKCAMSV